MALVVKDVVKRFGSKTVVDRLSFSMEKPGVFGLLGTNGAGKTTTIRMILGILEKDEGTIEWDGAPVTRETVNFGYLPEERGLYPKIKVGEQLEYFARLRGMDRRSAAESIRYWAERLEISQYIHMASEQLSKGNQQKVQLISAILHNPRLLILDEPFSGLDPLNTELFKSVIREMIGKGCLIVMSSHQMQAVEEYCSDILLLVGGKTVLQGNLSEIKRSYGRNTLFIRCEEASVPELTALAQNCGLTVKDTTAQGVEFRIHSEDQAYGLLRALLDKSVAFDKFEMREPTLHEIFLEKAGARS